MVDNINLHGWGDYKPVKKEERNEKPIDFQDVVQAFNQKYGKGTLVDPSQVDPYQGKKVIKLDELDQALGLKPKRPQMDFRRDFN